MGETLEDETLFNTISGLLIIDVLCILLEFVLHDEHYVEAHGAHVAGYWVKIISLSILGVFQAEACILMIAFGKHYWENWGHILDAMVIPVSIIFETQLGSSLGSLIVLLRFWRLIRVAHGVWESRQKKKQQAREHAKAKAKAAERARIKDLEQMDGYMEGDDDFAQYGQEYPLLFDPRNDELYDSDHEDFSHSEMHRLTKELEHFEEEEGPMHTSEICPEYRIEMHEFLDQPWVHNGISGLLVFDVMCVLGEFYLHDPYMYERHAFHDAGFYVGVCSISVLGFFQFECFMNMNCTGRFLLEFYGHFLDAIIVPVSLICEFTLNSGATSLLILLRFWRLVRIAHGIFVADEEREANKETLLAHKMKELSKQVTEHKRTIERRSTELERKKSAKGNTIDA